MTLIFAHRGCSGDYPENTLPAFEQALAVADGIELDVHLSRDYQLVVIHDETVDRTTNGSGLVNSLTVAQLQRLNAGANFTKKTIVTPVPTLEQVLDLLTTKGFRGSLNIEIKTDVVQYEGIEEILASLIAKHQPAFTVIFSSFHFASLEKLAQLLPTSNLAYLLHEEADKMKLAETTTFLSGMHPKITWLQAHPQLLKKQSRNWFSQVVQLFSRQQTTIKKEIRFWTVNREADMRLCFENKVTGFFTDYPERAQKIREEYNG